MENDNTPDQYIAALDRQMDRFTTGLWVILTLAVLTVAVAYHVMKPV